MRGPDPYAFAAGYYDLFRAKLGDEALPSVSFFTEFAPSDGYALEIGPGTGRATLAVAAKVAGLVCLERSATMRAVLLAKLAERPHLQARVTVLDVAVPPFRLDRRFDYAYFGGVLEHIRPADRPHLFRAVADHLADGGLLAMDMVLRQPAPDFPERVVDEVTVGECRYELAAAATALGPDESQLTYIYRTFHEDRLLATEKVERRHNMHRPEPVLADLAAAGLAPAPGLVFAGVSAEDPGGVVVRKEASA
ncbi:Methyltransferase domain protein [Micromonospora sp. MW-13]|uniref:class I SAM-dependent methyltransferase n=1 Tax=unclassified Micromonospora TaxID=2617518 RepID=UPI000ED0C0E4|nr:MULTISPECIES: class I SAM-dependent methyltransferase [unclassified Micromonospora]MCX4472495.1 class I SAM-dependent methyltransferase [Micromonospora sp. NBC_01655]RGC69183.1 Methyltransferase domain protein [Micromonospora sp. MW-13]